MCVIVSSVLQVASGHAYLCSSSAPDFVILPLALEYPKNMVPAVIATRTTARITLVNFPNLKQTQTDLWNKCNK